MQEYYAIDIDRRDEHSPIHVAACAVGLGARPGSRVLTEFDADNRWTLTDQLIAMNVTTLRWLCYWLGGCKGVEPEPIAPERVRNANKGKKKAEAMAMPIDELMSLLSKPRKGVS